MEAKEHLVKTLVAGKRYDGRGLEEFRQLKIETGISKSAEGSAKVLLGKTEVLIGVKLGIEEPYPDTPEQGNLMVNVELRPISNPAFEVGPPGEQAIEIARIVDRGIRESKVIDVKKLCIKPKEKVWSVMIDIVPLNDEGNLIDAASIGALAALKDVRLPKVDEDGNIDYLTKTKEKLPLAAGEPVAVTVYKIGSYMLVDPTYEEEPMVEGRLTVVTTKDDQIHALQKGGETPLTIEEVQQMVSMTLKIAPEIRKHI